jgi:hypothetical protein
MRGVTLAWLAGLTIITFRSARDYHMPPVPGQLLGASGLFALLALGAEYEPASKAAALAGWGFVTAALLAPGVIPATFGGTPKAKAAAPAPGKGKTTAGGQDT